MEGFSLVVAHVMIRSLTLSQRVHSMVSEEGLSPVSSPNIGMGKGWVCGGLKGKSAYMSLQEFESAGVLGVIVRKVETR